ncbi:hypothetical protein WR25_25016 [Diploscapter pachys]|uniref:Serine/threonine-protein kinase RIO1 n=1 Tax=Diploscapter pachys TaxID=2018661 RepID=A0A2A2JZG9_9BILA|nr:hypothetical protein WR25_25016 [Diploscapter pachys]
MEDILKENWTVNNILNAVDSGASASESDESDVEQTADDIINNISFQVRRVRFVQEDEDSEESTASDYEAEYAIDAGDLGDFTKRFNAIREARVGPNSQQNQKLQHDVERTAEAISQKKRKRLKDRADRATVEQVLDPRTRLVLFKLLQRNTLSTVNGCISTGKEANVYYATSELHGNLAIKIYKTSILTFKDRERYVTGEFRYRNGYCKSNPRKMVALWAEKELRNLMRMHEAGLPVPKPLLLKGHVLLMDFIGREGWPAPRLKNAELTSEKAESCYLQIVQNMRTLYRDCRLVHADLSEYNILYFEDKLYIIDVSQSVEHDHPHALEFLRIDCNNINKYFRELGVKVLTVRRLFELIADPLITNDEAAKILENERTASCEDDAVFMNAYIPNKLDEMMHFEREHKLRAAGKEPHNPFTNIISKVNPEVPDDDPDKSNTKKKKKVEEMNEEDWEKKEKRIQMHTRNSDETPEERKARKAAVKEEKRENRQDKIPKHVKKRAHRAHMK